MFSRNKKNRKKIEELKIKKLENFFNIKLSDSQIETSNNLYNGDVSNLETGEGKTFSIILTASQLNEKTFILLPNTYLADRDFNIGEKYFSSINKKAARLSPSALVDSDIIYTTLSELSDMILSLQQEDPLLYDSSFGNIKKHLIVDEIDVIVADLGATPFYSAIEKTFDSSNIPIFEKMEKYVGENGFGIDESTNDVYIEDTALNKILINLDLDLFSFENHVLLYQFSLYIKAKFVLKKDKNYSIIDNKIVIIDSVLKVTKPDFKFIGGLHQYLEYKEKLPYTTMLLHNNSITVKEIFSLFDSVSGCSATAQLSSGIIKEASGCSVLKVKPSLKSNRVENKIIFLTKKECINSYIQKLLKSKLLNKSNIIMFQNQLELDSAFKNFEGNILKTEGNSLVDDYHILMKVGKEPVTVFTTISSGRGVHIEASPEIKNKGGINIVLVGAFESERQLHQAKGRIGRRSAPGESFEIVSLADDVLLKYGGSNLKRILNYLKDEKECIISGKMYQKLYKKAMNEYSLSFLETMKLLFSYDEIIAKQRNSFLETKRIIRKDENFNLQWLKSMVLSAVNRLELVDFNFNINPYESFNKSIKYTIFINKNGSKEDLVQDIEKLIEIISETKDLHKEVEKLSMYLINTAWNENYEELVTLKEGIHLRSLNNKDPFSEFKKESYFMFEKISNKIAQNLVENIIGLSVYFLNCSTSGTIES